jgi:hypothetical protein
LSVQRRVPQNELEQRKAPAGEDKKILELARIPEEFFIPFSELKWVSNLSEGAMGEVVPARNTPPFHAQFFEHDISCCGSVIYPFRYLFPLRSLNVLLLQQVHRVQWRGIDCAVTSQPF